MTDGISEQWAESNGVKFTSSRIHGPEFDGDYSAVVFLFRHPSHGKFYILIPLDDCLAMSDQSLLERLDTGYKLLLEKPFPGIKP